MRTGEGLHGKGEAAETDDVSLKAQLLDRLEIPFGLSHE